VTSSHSRKKTALGERHEREGGGFAPADAIVLRSPSLSHFAPSAGAGYWIQEDHPYRLTAWKKYVDSYTRRACEGLLDLRQPETGARLREW